MKKPLLILLLTIYAVSVLGISVNSFYCCGRLQSTTISAAPFSKAGSADDGCCKHKQTVLKVNDSHEAGQVAKLAKAGFFAVNTTCNIYTIGKAYSCVTSARINAINAPPLLLHTPLYTQYCNYRI